jgi:hypothetical protein
MWYVVVYGYHHVNKWSFTMSDKLKALYAAGVQHKNKIANTALVACAAVAGSAHAALPADVDTMFTGLQADGEAAIAKMWPLMLAITGGFILVGIVRRALTSGAR